MNPISRRQFVTLSTAGALAAPGIFHSRTATMQAGLTAQQVVDRIRQKVGVEWKTDTVDTFKAGDPATVVKGIATTAMATMDVLRQAAKAGANLVITSEPTFYSKADSSAPAGARRGAAAAPDAIFTAKNEFIKSNGLVVWRFSDHWRLRTPDPLSVALADALGWAKSRAADDPRLITLPSIALDSLASDLKKKLNTRGGMRIVGDPRSRIQKVGLLPGTTAVAAALSLFQKVDAIVAGEVREWETVELARDKVAAGENKSLILIGRVVSEDPGMNACAQWLKTIVPELPTTWIAVGDPYWRPA